MANDVIEEHAATGRVLREDHATARIGIERSRRGWSTTGLSDRLNHRGYRMNPSAVWRIENGKRRIHLDEAIGFADLFGIPLTELISPPALTSQAAELIEIVARAERALHQAQDAHQQASNDLAAYLADHSPIREEAGAGTTG